MKLMLRGITERGNLSIKYRPDFCPVAHTEDTGLSKVWEMVKDRKPGVLQSIGSQRFRHD